MHAPASPRSPNRWATVRCSGTHSGSAFLGMNLSPSFALFLLYQGIKSACLSIGQSEFRMPGVIQKAGLPEGRILPLGGSGQWERVGVMRSRTWPGYRDRCAAHWSKKHRQRRGRFRETVSSVWDTRSPENICHHQTRSGPHYTLS